MNAQTKLSTLAGLALLMALTPAAHAINGCTNNWPLYGTYGMQFYGATAPNLAGGVGGVIAPLSSAGGSPVAAVAPLQSTGGIAVGFAQLTLDGAGGVSGISHANLNGAWSEGTVTGAYTVNNDCTLSLSLVDLSGASQNFTGAVVERGTGAVLIQTDAGTGVSAELQSTRNWCATPDLTGTFSFRSFGSMVGANSGGSAYSSVGLLSLDGQGNATATESRFVNGASYQVASSGAITVNADCSVAVALTPTTGSGNSLNFRGFLSSDETQMILVQTDANTAVRGSVMVQ